MWKRRGPGIAGWALSAGCRRCGCRACRGRPGSGRDPRPAARSGRSERRAASEPDRCCPGSPGAPAAAANRAAAPLGPRPRRREAAALQRRRPQCGGWKEMGPRHASSSRPLRQAPTFGMKKQRIESSGLRQSQYLSSSLTGPGRSAPALRLAGPYSRRAEPGRRGKGRRRSRSVRSNAHACRSGSGIGRFGSAPPVHGRPHCRWRWQARPQTGRGCASARPPARVADDWASRLVGRPVASVCSGPCRTNNGTYLHLRSTGPWTIEPRDGVRSALPGRSVAATPAPAGA